jgi:peroxiredoxin Q/BCP
MKRDPVPPLVCLVLFLSTLWANVFSEQQSITFAWGKHPPAAASDLPTGVEAPDFRLPDVEGKWVSLTSLRGRKLLVVFLPKCEGCPLGTAAHWDDLCAQRTDATLVILTPVSRQELEGLRKKGFKARLLSSVGTDVEKRYYAYFRPRLYLIDPLGTVRYVQPFGAQSQEVERAVQEFLREGEKSL